MSVSVSDLVVAVASADDAAAMVEVIHAAFGARPPLDPPSTAIDETPESVTASLSRRGRHLRPGRRTPGRGDPGGCPTRPELAHLRTGSRCTRTSSATASPRRWSTAAEELAATMGFGRVELFAREEFAELIAFWQHRGFAIDRDAPHGVILAKPLPLAVRIPTAAAMQRLGDRLAALLRPGDVIIAAGELGAGKTTLTQGLGEGLARAARSSRRPSCCPGCIRPAPAGRRWCTSTPTG